MMSVPSTTTVLVIGGGPAGSYAASILAREGHDVAVLEADVFPRYHIGESMLPSMRYFLRFIDLEEQFDKHQFEKKFGATFKLTGKREAYTDFAASLGPGGHSWNVVRSECDDMMFRHAGKSGAHIFDGTKVEEIEFVSNEAQGTSHPSRPVAAKWSRKDGTSGRVQFDFLIDASGRAGVVSSKYLKNRKQNEALRHIANWAYWKGAARYGAGTQRENSPFFEALQDKSGWSWMIPLHNGTVSVGTVQQQKMFFAKKKARNGISAEQNYREDIKFGPETAALLEGATIVSDIKQASDWSYSASYYAGPYMRLAGDAGCFIDPFFSSGLHLAFYSALSAATTICASIKGTVDEMTAAKWHSSKVTEGYTRFLIIVMTIMRQMRNPQKSLLDDDDDDGYDKAFDAIQPIIQGVADTAEEKEAQAKAAAGVEFMLKKLQSISPAQQQAVLGKIYEADDAVDELARLPSEEHMALLGFVLRTMSRVDNANTYTNNVLNNWRPNLKRGSLDLTIRNDSTVVNGSNGTVTDCQAGSSDDALLLKYF